MFLSFLLTVCCLFSAFISVIFNFFFFFCVICVYSKNETLHTNNAHTCCILQVIFDHSWKTRAGSRPKLRRWMEKGFGDHSSLNTQGHSRILNIREIFKHRMILVNRLKFQFCLASTVNFSFSFHSSLPRRR